MEEWYLRTGELKVREWIEKVASWVEAGFFSPDVWLDLKQHARSDVLCDYIETASVEKKTENAADDRMKYLTNLTFSRNN